MKFLKKNNMENEYLTLVYCGQYVDVNLLERGIYVSRRPFIFDIGTTIDMLYNQAKDSIDILGSNDIISDRYIVNLRLCRLVRIDCVFID
jgi:hypothetical protein